VPVLARLAPVPLLALLLAGCTSFADRRADDVPPTAVAVTGTPLPATELDGRWSGEGSLTDCAGFDQGCPETLAMTLAIDCSGAPCVVTPFDGEHGSPPLRFEDGRYRATGPVPADDAPRCGGAPASTALWRLDVAARDGVLTGSYSESTLQSFDCGATFVAWQVPLEAT
jgi:hypothetical protein